MHVPRTPESTLRPLELSSSDGVVLHMQFAFWKRTQLKQAHARCAELVLATSPAWHINRKYAVAQDHPGAKVECVPDAWRSAVEISVMGSPHDDHYLADLFRWFDEFGILFFEPLDIWSIPELQREFVNRVGRKPHRPASVGPVKALRWKLWRR